MRPFRLLAVTVLVILMVAFMLQPVAAATLDQQQTSIVGGLLLYSSPPEPSFQDLSQTFTAGLTGSLTEVDLAVGCEVTAPPSSLPACTSNGPVTVEIHSGGPAGPLLGSPSSLDFSAIPNFFSKPPKFSLLSHSLGFRWLLEVFTP
jgi:hypothetical protein